MPENDKSTPKFDQLRQQAEELIRKRPNLPPDAPDDIMELIHELKLHQTELHLQNEELKRSQGELSELQREFRDLYEFAPCGYLTLDEKGLITRANLTAVELLETNRQQLVGSGLRHYIIENGQGLYSIAQENYLKTKEKQTFEIELKTTRTSSLWVRVEMEADFFLDDTGQVMQWRLTLHDISDYLEALRRKEYAEAELVQAKKIESIGNLAGGIAHDFNNILSSMIGFTELALDDAVEGSAQQDDLKEVFRAGMRAKELVTQILTFARKTNEEVKPVKIKSIITDSIGLLRSSIANDITIKENIKSESQVIGNPALLEQVIINLVSNAADAMENDGGRIEIACEDITIDDSNVADQGLLGKGDHVQIIVSDNGTGIAPDLLDQIFEPYFTTKKFGKGTGMGLATVHGTVKKYGGSITVKSQLGQGTVFTILFPVTEVAQSVSDYRSDILPTGSEHILVVDDDPAIVKLTTLILERLGYTVTARINSIEALELFAATPDDFDLVLSDVTMPNLSGDNLTKELMKIRPTIPVMLLTGYSENISEQTADEIGVKAFAYKPIVKADLAHTLRKVLDEANG